MSLENQDEGAQRRQEIIQFCAETGRIIGKEALSLLEGDPHWREVLEKTTGPIVSEATIRQELARHETKLGDVKEAIVKKGRPTGLAKDSDSDFRVMREMEITEKSTSEGKVGDFLSYFNDKYNFLSSLLSRCYT